VTTAPDLDAAIAALRRGAVVVYPTETLYGLGARALDAAAVGAVAALKGRDAAKPIAVIASDIAMAERVLDAPSPLARRLMARFWPGALTLVLPARPGLPAALTAAGAVGVRVSAHPVARALAAAVGEPITATSANPGGAPAPATLAAARAYFATGVAAFVDGGALAGGAPSTVVSIAAHAVRLVREGAVSIAAIQEVLGSTPIELPEHGE
jgi:L-threonylcarbamoyladenylate synthase